MAPQREWFEKDYYEVLGVSQDASAKDVTRAYRKLAKQYHPDANPGDAAAEEKFKEISAANDVLGDAEKRKEYDEVRRMVASGMGPGNFGGPGGPGGPGGGFPGGGNVRFEDLGDLGGIFGNLFGGGGGGGGGGRRGRRGGPVGPQRGHDIETELHLDFLEAVHGVTTGVNITSEATCSVCNGSGAKPGTVPDTCGTCGGAGSVAVDQGPFSFSQVCPTCGGRGAIVKDKCKHCKGRGVEVRPRTVKVRIPAGVDDGQRIRVKGRGAAGAVVAVVGRSARSAATTSRPNCTSTSSRRCTESRPRSTSRPRPRARCATAAARSRAPFPTPAARAAARVQWRSTRVRSRSRRCAPRVVAAARS